MNKILIIEDDITIAELQRDYLEISGFSVDIQQQGDEGLRQAREKIYDLIILDVMLPVMDGFEICRQIRKEMDIPILMISAKKEDVDKILGLGLGADDYMTKPFSPSELVARVKAHIARYDRLSGNQKHEKGKIKIRGLSVDQVSRRVYMNDKEVILTSKEFDLLKLLASNPNRVFTKEELFDKVWGMDSLGDISTVTVHIRRLREKIELEPSKPQYIHTIWGVGYRFEV